MIQELLFLCTGLFGLVMGAMLGTGLWLHWAEQDAAMRALALVSAVLEAAAGVGLTACWFCERRHGRRTTLKPEGEAR